MKIKFLPSIISCLLFFTSFSQNSQFDAQRVRVDTTVCAMPDTDIINEYKVPRSDFVKQKMTNSDSGRNNCSTFIVSYFGFENQPEAQAAFQFAVDIWESLLVSDATIRIQATWEPASPGNLGSARPAYYKEIPSEPSNPNALVLYPAPLYEKIIGMDRDGLFGTSTDIICNFNSSRTDWYFGTDANPVRNEFDFVTVVLHELGHGLGFAGFGASNNGLGYIRREEAGDTFFLDGSSEYASIWDTFVQGVIEPDGTNGNGIDINVPILQQGEASFGWDEASTAMIQEFQSSGKLTCFGPIATTQNGGAFPNFFAPTPFNGGSSYSHLDEDTFNNTANALMTPFAARGEANHDPGNVTLGFMEDMGWSLCQGSLSTNDFNLASVKISPNPFTESLTINLPSEVANQEFDVTIVDINGRIVSRNSENSNGKITVRNLENLRSALYFLTIESKITDLRITKKIIKQ